MEMVGYIYNADNMNNTFKAGDKVYCVPQETATDGQMIAIRRGETVEVKYFYHAAGGYILTDDKNPPERLSEPPQIVGVIVGYERLFDLPEVDLNKLSPEAYELMRMAVSLPAEDVKKLIEYFNTCEA